MNCLKHENREAIAMCVKCHKLICEECAVKINNKYYCKECISEMHSNKENEIYNKNEVIDDFQHLNDNDESNLFLNTNVDFQSNINKNVSNKSFITPSIIIVIPSTLSPVFSFTNSSVIIEIVFFIKPILQLFFSTILSLPYSISYLSPTPLLLLFFHL